MKRSRSMQEHLFTKEELAGCNGKDGAPAFVSYIERVYDGLIVSFGRMDSTRPCIPLVKT